MRYLNFLFILFCVSLEWMIQFFNVCLHCCIIISWILPKIWIFLIISKNSVNVTKRDLFTAWSDVARRNDNLVLHFLQQCDIDGAIASWKEAWTKVEWNYFCSSSKSRHCSSSFSLVVLLLFSFFTVSLWVLFFCLLYVLNFLFLLYSVWDFTSMKWVYRFSFHTLSK